MKEITFCGTVKGVVKYFEDKAFELELKWVGELKEYGIVLKDIKEMAEKQAEESLKR